MSYYPELDRHIKDKVKVILNLSNYGTKVPAKKELEHATGVDTCDLAATKDFIAIKNEVDKINIIKLVNVPTCVNILKTKVDDLDVGELKTVPIDLKKLSGKKVAKITKFSTLERKVNKLDKKFLMQLLKFILLNTTQR